jgi:hypothetical protein
MEWQEEVKERKQSRGSAQEKSSLMRLYLNENNPLPLFSPEIQYAVHHTCEAGAGVLDLTMNDSRP